ncbi:MAG TPA: hypothetical protein VN416_01755 [Desulfomonilia bacterium]|nr:hypothetical protein [Desulfomonilia bacterium]
MSGRGVHCPDFTRDLTIRAKAEETQEAEKPKAAKGKKKTGEVHFL